MEEDIELDNQYYSGEEIEELKKIFDIFDRNKSGLISQEDIKEIMRQIGKDSARSREILYSVGTKADSTINFVQFIDILERIEQSLANQPSEPLEVISQQPQFASAESKEQRISEFLEVLDNYRQKFEQDGNYEEAKKAQKEYDALRAQEVIRQFGNVKQKQAEEKEKIVSAQQSQFMAFSTAWDKYMTDYENTAYESLQKLKERQMKELEDFTAKVRKEAKKKVKSSKELIYLRKHCNTLAKMKDYDQAAVIKDQADKLEEWEKTKAQTEVENTVLKKCQALKQKQSNELNALLKRIERDRNEQVKHREADSSRLARRNQNLTVGLANRQRDETSKMNEILKRELGDVKALQGSGKKKKGKKVRNKSINK